MKRLISLVVLLSLLLMTGCVDKNAQAKELAQQLADRLGRTTANSMVEMPVCGAFVCIYAVYFTTLESKDEINARIQTVNDLGLQGKGAAPILAAGTDLINQLEGELRGTTIKERLGINRGTNISQSYWLWLLQNAQGEKVVNIYIYRVRESGLEYKFGNRLLVGDIVHISVFVNPQKS